eukprot:15250875-Alexandrium_andersonii.AAC.1
MPPGDTLKALNELFDSEALADARAGPIRYDAAHPAPPDGRATEWALYGEPGDQHWHRLTPVIPLDSPAAAEQRA